VAKVTVLLSISGNTLMIIPETITDVFVRGLIPGRRRVTPGEVCREIDRLAVGDYKLFGGRLVDGQDPRASIRTDDLLNTPMRKPIDRRFAQRFEVFDARAVHSIWVNWYLNGFIPPILLADILLGQSVGVGLSHFIIGSGPRSRCLWSATGLFVGAIGAWLALVATAVATNYWRNAFFRQRCLA
jgi:hypothetical protein